MSRRDDLETLLNQREGDQRWATLVDLLWETRSVDAVRFAELAAELVAVQTPDQLGSDAVAGVREGRALVALANGDLDEAERWLAAPEEPERSAATSARMESLKAKLLMARGRCEAATQVLESALDRFPAQANGDTQNLSVASGAAVESVMLDDLGQAYAAAGKPGRAQAAFRRCLELAPGTSPDQVVLTHIHLGDALGNGGDLEGALESYQIARDLLGDGPLSATQKPALQMLALQRLAMASEQLHRPTQALEYCLQALKGCHAPDRSSPDSQCGSAGVEIDLRILEGTCRSRLGQHDDSDRALTEALQWATAAGDSSRAARARTEKARLRWRAGALDEALQIVTEALVELDALERNPDPLDSHAGPHSRARAQQLLALIHAQQGDSEGAKDALAAASILATEIDHPELELSVEDCASEVCELLGDHRGAVEHLRRLHRLEQRRLRRGARARVEGLELAQRYLQARQRAELLDEMREDLTAKVRERTGQLEDANRQLRRALEEQKRTEGERATLETQLRQAQKMEAIGRLASGVAHDFNNILTVVQTYAECLGDDLNEADRSMVAEEILAAVKRGSGFTRQLLAFGRKQPRVAQILVVDEVLVEMERLLLRLIDSDVELDLQVREPGMRVFADAAQLEQVVLNLVMNARDAMPDGGTLDMVLDKQRPGPGSPLPDEDFAHLSIRDTGHGMDLEVQKLVFDPFFTTKSQGKGTGLGLSIAYGIVTQAGGDMVVESKPEQGTTFHIYLPLTEQDKVVEQTSEPQSTPRRLDNMRVLLVDDDADIRRLLTLRLRQLGGDVTLAEDGAEALEKVSTASEPFALVITDVVMPKLTGTALTRVLQREYPDLPVIVTSGYPDRVESFLEELPQSAVYLPKPFGLEDLQAAVNQAMGPREER